jgi:lysyl-tRNA synthetase class 1
VASGTVVFEDEDGTLTEVPVTDGHCKMQWKCDWALRWAALDVNYEMSGKDLIESVKLSSRICRVLDGLPPEGFSYELFLDERGQKISKSKGNGLTIEEWLRYGTAESLELFLYRDPKKAKRLHFDVIPRNVDEYEAFLEAFPRQAAPEQVGNPLWHIHDSRPPVEDRLPPGLTFGMLLNLASVASTEDAAVLWGFIGRYAPGTSAETSPRLARLVEHSLAYYRDFVRPTRRYREPTDQERAALGELRAWLGGMPEGAPPETLQHEIYEIGKRHGFASLRDWFKALYEVLLGQSEGPRFGSFVAIYGVADTCALIDARLAEAAAAE